MAQFGIGTESQPCNLQGRQYHQQARTATASPMLSQPLAGTQRSTAGLQLKGSSGCSMQQHSNLSQLGPVSQQQAYSSRPMSGFGPSQHQPALSGVFRPGSAPQASQLDVLSASQWPQPGAGGLGAGLNPRNSEPAGHANGGLLRLKPVSLLRGLTGNSSSSLAGQLQNRPGSAPDLLYGAAPPNMYQHRPSGSLLGPNQRNQQHMPQQQQQQQRGPSGLGLATSGSQQQQPLQGMIISGSQQKYEQYNLGHASQGLLVGVGLEFDSTGGTETAGAAALLESQQQQQQQQMPQGNRQPHQLLQLPLGAKDGAPGSKRGGSKAAGMQQGEGHVPLWQEGTTAALPAAAQGNTPAAAVEAYADGTPAANSAKAAAREQDASQAAAVQRANAAAAAAAAVAAANVDLVKRISSLEECCNCMSSIVKRDIPTLLRQQSTTQDKLQVLENNLNSNHNALERRMEVLASSVASFMDGLRTWQQEKQQLQQQREAERLQQEQQHAVVGLSSVACQTTPGVLGGKPRDAAAAAVGGGASAAAAAAAPAAAFTSAVNRAPTIQQAAVTSPSATRYNRNKPNTGFAVLANGNSHVAGPTAGQGTGSGIQQHGDAAFDGYAGLTQTPSSPLLPAAAAEPFAPAACNASGVAPAGTADSSEQGNTSGTSKDAAQAPTARAAARRGAKAGGRKKPTAVAKCTAAKNKQADGLVQSKITFSSRPATRRAAAAAAAAELAKAAASQQNAPASAKRTTAAAAVIELPSMKLAAGALQSPGKTHTAPALSLPNGAAGRCPPAAAAAAGSHALAKTAMPDEAATATGTTDLTPWFTKRGSGSSSSKQSDSSEQQIKQQQEAPAKPIVSSRQGIKSGGCTAAASGVHAASAAAGAPSTAGRSQAAASGGAAVAGGVCRPTSMTQQQHTQQPFELQQQQQNTVQIRFQRRSSSGTAVAAGAAGQGKQAPAAVYLPPAPLQGRKGAAGAASGASALAAAAADEVPGQPIAGAIASKMRVMAASGASRPTGSTVSAFAEAAAAAAAPGGGGGGTARPTVSGAGRATFTRAGAEGATFTRAGAPAASGAKCSMFHAGSSRSGAAAGLKRSRSLLPAPPAAPPPAAAPIVPAGRPASSSVLMLFGEMDSDSLDGVIDSQDTENQADQNTAPHFSLFDSTTAAETGALSTVHACAAASMHCCTGMDTATAATGTAGQRTAAAAASAGAVRPTVTLSGRGAVTGSRLSARTIMLPESMMIDDDELAQQVAARMVRHRNKRFRAMRSMSQMG